jgi:hypothetical protein
VTVGLGRSLAAGAVGAVAVTLANEIGRRAISDAPRLDLLGSRALAKLTGKRAKRLVPGKRKDIARAALAGDLAANALYYALAGPGRSPTPVSRGLWLGVLAGVGAVVLAPKLGLGHRGSDATVETAALTVAWYAIGGLAAGIAARALAPKVIAYETLSPAGVVTSQYPWPPAQRAW